MNEEALEKLTKTLEEINMKVLDEESEIKEYVRKITSSRSNTRADVLFNMMMTIRNAFIMKSLWQTKITYLELNTPPEIYGTNYLRNLLSRLESRDIIRLRRTSLSKASFVIVEPAKFFDLVLNELSLWNAIRTQREKEKKSEETMRDEKTNN